MMNKSVLIVTGSDYSSRVYQGFKDAIDFGCKLYLLSDGSFEPTPGIFEKTYTFDLRKTKEVLEYMKSQPVIFDAVTIKTSEWLTPLTALLAKEYGCIGNDPIVAFNCRSKYHMRKILREAGVPSPKYKLCRDYKELIDAAHEIGTPCVAKPVGGNASYGTFMIRDENDISDLNKSYDNAIDFLKMKAVSEDVFAFSQEEMDLMGVSNHVDMVTDYLVEEYMEGPEISVDAVCQNGKVSIIAIEDQIRMSPPYFMQIIGKLPYTCTEDQKIIISELIEKTIRALGIINSCTHTEIIFTREGPKIVEIGCRIGGDDLHDTIFEVTGVNLMFESIMIALGVERNYENIETRCHTIGQFLLPESAGKILSIRIPESVTLDPDVIELQLLLGEGDHVAPPPICFDSIGYVSVRGQSPGIAERKLENVLSAIDINITPFAK